jgi:chemotaxis signal transduction protein
MSNESDLDQRVSELRASFARGFAVPYEPSQPDLEDLLAIRVAGEPYALRVRDIIEVVARKQIVPAPTAFPAFIGLVGIRGGVVPVYSLGALLGHTHDASQARWLALHDRAERCALAFDELESYDRVRRSDVHPVPEGEGRTGFASVVELRGAMRAVIDLTLVVSNFEARARAGVSKEQ